MISNHVAIVPVEILNKIQVNQTHTTTEIENQQTVLVDQIVLQTHIILLTTQDTNIVVQMTIQIIVSKEYSPVTHIVKVSKLYTGIVKVPTES